MALFFNKTPIVRFPYKNGLIYIKLEGMNFGGSVKDRFVKYLFSKNDVNEKINQKNGVIEATSGNTGIAIALECAKRNYKCKIVTHNKASREKVAAMQFYGAEVITIDTSAGGKHYTEIANDIAKSENLFIVDQFNNKLNPESHEVLTAPEMHSQIDDEIDAFICGIGSGGTIMGFSNYFEKNKLGRINIVASDPIGSIYHPMFYKKDFVSIPWIAEGVGSDFIPSILDLSKIDEIVQYSDDDLIGLTGKIGRALGVGVGFSSVGSIFCAMQLIDSGRARVVGTIAADNIDKYLSKV